MGEDGNAPTVASGEHTHGDETVNNEGQEDSIVDQKTLEQQKLVELQLR